MYSFAALGLLGAACNSSPECSPGTGHYEYRWQSVVVDATGSYEGAEWSAGFGVDIGVHLAPDSFEFVDLDDALLAYPGNGEFVWPREVAERSQASPVIYFNFAEQERRCHFYEGDVTLTSFEVLDYEGEARIIEGKSGGDEFDLDENYHRLYEITLAIDATGNEDCETRPPPFELTFRAELTAHDVYGYPSDRCEDID